MQAPSSLCRQTLLQCDLLLPPQPAQCRPVEARPRSCSRPCVVACRSIGHVSQPPRFCGLDGHAAVETVLLRSSILKRYPRGYAVHHAWAERCSLLGFSAQPPARVRSSTSACTRCGFRSPQRGEGRRRRGIGYILRTTEDTQSTTCGYDSITSPTRAQASIPSLLFLALAHRKNGVDGMS